MKSASLSFLVFVILTCSSAFSETELKLSDILARDFTTISVNDARILVHRAGKAENGNIPDEFVKSAIESGRLEIMEVCLENNYVYAYFAEQYRKMPNGRLKSQLFSMRFRSNISRWPDDTKLETDMHDPRLSLVESYIPVLRRYIPDLPMDYTVLNTREKRLALADIFDKAAGIPIVVEPEAVHVWPPKAGGKAETTSTARTDPRAPPTPSAAPAPLARAASLQDGGFLWLSAAAAALAAGIAWLFTRSRRNG